MKSLRLTIGRKLMLGFSLVVAILVVMSAVTYSQVRGLVAGEQTVMKVDLPTQTLALQVQGQVHAALSAHRGYIILGLDSLKEDRAAIWKQIDANIAELQRLTEHQHDSQATALIGEVKTILAAFKASQQQIVDVAHTAENEPALLLFEESALPYGKKMQQHLEAILEIEHDQPTTAERKILVNRIASAEIHLLKVTAAITQFLATGKPAQQEVIADELAACSASVAELKQQTRLFTPPQRQHFDAYIEARSSFIDVAKQVITQRAAADWNMAQFICANEVTPLATRADEVLENIVAHAEDVTSGHGDALTARAQFMQRTVVVLAIVAVAAATVIALLLRRMICPPIVRAAEAARMVAAGDLTVRVDAKANDECGDLGRGFNQMLGNMSEMITHVIAATQEVNAASTQIATTSEEINQGMSSQSSQVTQISAAIEEMSASVIEVARKSADAARNAEQAGESATQGGQIVDETITEINAIRSAVDDSSASVKDLGKRGEQIGQIIAVINDIADQTNLLALNAAIEAARAGEHGRGFAVVADEVRKLADRTTQATEEIGSSISAIQTETGNAVHKMDQGSRQVQTGVSKATTAGQSLAQIVANSREVASMVQSIAAATEEQSATSEEVARSIESIASVTEQSQQGSHQAAQAAAMLADRAGHLQELVGRFRVEDTN